MINRVSGNILYYDYDWLMIHILWIRPFRAHNSGFLKYIHKVVPRWPLSNSGNIPEHTFLGPVWLCQQEALIQVQRRSFGQGIPSKRKRWTESSPQAKALGLEAWHHHVTPATLSTYMPMATTVQPLRENQVHLDCHTSDRLKAGQAPKYSSQNMLTMGTRPSNTYSVMSQFPDRPCCCVVL